jgi:two-component system LytT family response regulator
MLKTTTTLFDRPLFLGKNITFLTNEILYFEGDINYTWIHFITRRPKKIIAKTLLGIEEKTNADNFIRVSRKHLVNRKFITAIGADFVMLANQTILPISRRRKGMIYQQLRVKHPNIV